ncbi:hypothetical protein F4679DRAFT_578419 [Xylaria curta]|nr:hypothetical protein F4679DRAFT_578419 [Xylaria curta]
MDKRISLTEEAVCMSGHGADLGLFLYFLSFCLIVGQYSWTFWALLAVLIAVLPASNSRLSQSVAVDRSPHVLFVCFGRAVMGLFKLLSSPQESLETSVSKTLVSH